MLLPALEAAAKWDNSSKRPQEVGSASPPAPNILGSSSASRGFCGSLLGGRGIVAGAQLRRFYPSDFTLWPDAHWPGSAANLSDYYTLAEVRRHVRPGDCDGAAQNWVLGQLNPFNASPPPWGVDSPTVRNLEAGEGYDSSVARLWTLVLDDHQIAFAKKCPRRLLIATHSYVTCIEKSGDRVTGVVCKDSRRTGTDSPEIRVGARMIILAASPVESARLMLLSRLGNEWTGCYLAEHMYCRRSISVAPPREIGSLHRLAVRVVVPPKDGDRNNRFQIEVLGEANPQDTDQLLLRFTAEAAMEPRRENKVTLACEPDSGSPILDEWLIQKAHVTMLKLDDRPEDKTRLAVLTDSMWRLAERLGVQMGEFHSAPIEPLPFGRSHHEAGTLRMGHSDDLKTQPAVTDSNGRVFGIENLYVADASVFPCVGVANPMLTVTALGYRLADHIASVLSRP